MVTEREVLENYKRLAEEISAACREYGRDESEILVIGASKTMPQERVRFVAENTGVKVFGENRVQELLEKYTPDYHWHFIGQLQSNKVKYVVDKVDLIHSVDRISLLEEIDKQAKKADKVQDVLIEINMGAEITKGGIAPNDVVDFAKEVVKFPNVRLSGIMSVLPNVETQLLENFYLQLRDIYDTLIKIKLNNADVRYLSAGMSNDYRIALKYGANILRLGRALFGER